MRNVLVTGGAGFIGGNFVHYWRGRFPKDRIIVLDALTYAGKFASIEGLLDANTVFVHGDITDAELVSRVYREYDIDTVVHFAAESHVDRSIVRPAAFVTTNIVGTQVLIDVARAVWKSESGWRSGVRFHHVSTDEVYGSLLPHEAPFTESSPYVPSSPYAASKAGADHLVRAYMHTFGLPATISNCSNNYGPFQFPEKLVPLMIVNALEGRALPVYGDGRQVRDWLYVVDHCAAIEHIVERGKVGATYNVGAHSEVENIELVNQVCTVLDACFSADGALRERFPNCPAARGQPCASLVQFVADRPGHDRRYALDAGRIERELSFKAATSLTDGLHRTVDWYLSNEPWWRSVMNGSYNQWISEQYGESETA